jgi:hypothetical protein
MGASEASTTDTAVGMAVGTQVPYPLDLLVGTVVTRPVAWLGFPQRFGRDVGIPLVILVALSFVTILRSLGAPRPSSLRPWWCS